MTSMEIEIEFKFIGALYTPAGVLVIYATRVWDRPWTVDTVVVPYDYDPPPDDGEELLLAA